MLALINRKMKIGLLSRMAEKVVFVLIPPLALIFLVLGTIFIGIATPTEGGGMGALGAMILAMINRRLSWDLLKQAMNSTTRLSCFVVFILIGSTVFSLVFRGVNGDLWVEHLLSSLLAATPASWWWSTSCSSCWRSSSTSSSWHSSWCRWSGRWPTSWAST